MSVNPFILPAESYQRDLSIMQHYVDHVASYLTKMTGKPLDDCKTYVKKNLGPDGKFPFKDPNCHYLERKENGDRVKTEGPLSKYIGDAIQSKSLIAATFTIYHPPSKIRSYLVDFIEINVKKRGVAKKAMFVAEQAGDTFLYAVKKAEQNNKKTNNNSLSGAHGQASTPLYNKTAHSTLTSTCRSTSGYGNANNEKFLSGNRHYWAPFVVRNNIISIINLIDMNGLQKTMDQYGLRHPSVDETMECITYSTNLYWRVQEQLKGIRNLVEKLSPVERSAFVYTGDLYHLAKYNDASIRTFITKLSQRAETPIDDPETYMKSSEEVCRHLAVLMCPDITKGLNHKEIEKCPGYGIVAATTKNIEDTLAEYSNFIATFCLSPVVPSSLASFPTSMRRSALTSDTDSTIFTVQDWVTWHHGKMGFDDKSNATADSLVFLASQSIIHILARMSANFGIETSRIFKMAMKNEFKFDVFIPTQVAKHYFALISSQEGNVFKDFKLEIKGVHLKSSNVPKKIIKTAEEMMKEILLTVRKGELVEVFPLLKQIGDIERDIRQSVEKGSHEYFRVTQIKQESSYQGRPGMESNYWHYLFWEEVFAPKYGHTQAAPYTAVKISIGLNSKNKLKAWIESFDDRELADRMTKFMEKSNRDKLTTLWLPEQRINSVGVPKEILSQVDIRKIIFGVSSVFYLICEILGLYMTNKKITRLISDHY